jgi:hypothetical protein
VIPGDTGLKFYWWPKLATVAGWHHERGASLHCSSNSLAPDGVTFSNAETVIYARAIYKPREPAVKTLAMLIENDRKDFVANSPGIEISEVEALATADGKKFRSFTFSPKASGGWQRHVRTLPQIPLTQRRNHGPELLPVGLKHRFHT